MTKQRCIVHDLNILNSFDVVADLFSSFPSFHRADGEAESGGSGNFWNVHVVVQPLVPPEINRKQTICYKGERDPGT